MTAIILRRKGLGKASCQGISEKSQQGIGIVRNWLRPDWQGQGGISNPLIVFRWGCTSNVPDAPGNPANVINSAKAIHWCTDKRASRLAMQEAGVFVPDTYPTEQFQLRQRDGYNKWVLRPSRHAQGRNLVSGTDYDICSALEHGSTYTGGYVSRLIDKVAEYRVYIVQGRVVGVGNKTPADPTAIAWNMAQGGSFANVRWGEWPLAVVQEALKAVTLSGLDFAGVDVMVDAEGKVYVLELNSAPSLGPYMQGCFAKAFDYIIANGKDALPYQGTPSWKLYIHPAIWSG